MEEAKKEKKGFIARLFDRMDKKLEEKSKNKSCCCCNNDKNDDKKSCSN